MSDEYEEEQEMEEEATAKPFICSARSAQDRPEIRRNNSEDRRAEVQLSD